jgi:acyl carrier protein
MNTDEFYAYVAKHLEIDSLTPEDKIIDIVSDSLEMISLMSDIELHYSVAFEPRDFYEWETFGDIYEDILRRVV